MYTSKTYSNGWHYGEITKKDKGNRELRCWEKRFHFTKSRKERCVYDNRIFEHRSK